MSRGMPVAGGFVGSQLNAECDRLTLWIDRDDRKARSAGGMSLEMHQVEALIWRLANLRNHMAIAKARREPVAEAGPIPLVEEHDASRLPAMPSRLGKIRLRRNRSGG